MKDKVIRSKHPKDSFWIVWVLTAIIILMLSTRLHATECEVLNLDTNKCEYLVDQNLSDNAEWIEFY